MEQILKDEIEIKEEQLKENVKPYEFKKFTSQHIFMMTKLLSKIGIKEFKKAFSVDDIKSGKIKSKGLEQIGLEVVFDIIDIIFKNLHDCQEDLYSLLSSISNLDQNEIKELPMAVFAEMVIEMVQKEDFMDFIEVVSRLFN